MIHSFSCKNFYSFGEETTLNFVVNNNVPENNGYFMTPSGIRLSKVETVIGPNASGKTNLLKILPFLKWLIIDSFNAKPEDPIVVKSFAFGEAKNEPTYLSVVFEIDEKVYTYEFVITKEKILNEELKLTSFVKEKKSTKKIFSRNWNEKENRYDFDGENFELPKGFENLLRTNASVIGTAARLNHAESKVIAKYWGQIETNVVEAGWIGDHLLPNSIVQLGEAFNFFSENSVLKTEAEKLLCRFDLGLSGFEIKKEKKENGFSLNVQATHLFNGQKQYLPVQYESSGTKQLFVLLKSILVALEKGSIAVIDEFDVNLHPEMVIALYDLFVQPETNPKNAQLFMSTHSHILLSKLDKYQIILVEKNENGISEAWRLDEVSDVRSDENYYSKYLAGTYGAVPKI
ncbi:ATP-binding protein [Patescibacteria group bacterium]|nr:ATP-binding protein [Patescibacteria group bacterium]MBU4016343.1 ATP-binding protein [Patescibacteria group bacterium]MBU4099637.1 ATP-binding protein [Patescibacteria group bacterium]